MDEIPEESDSLQLQADYFIQLADEILKNKTEAVKSWFFEMKEEEARQKIGKKVRILLRNNFTYSGVVLGVTADTIVITDKFNSRVSIYLNDIMICSEISLKWQLFDWNGKDGIILKKCRLAGIAKP